MFVNTVYVEIFPKYDKAAFIKYVCLKVIYSHETL